MMAVIRSTEQMGDIEIVRTTDGTIRIMPLGLETLSGAVEICNYEQALDLVEMIREYAEVLGWSDPVRH